MKYVLVQFIEGWDFQAYQVASEDGWNINWYDLDGNLISTGMGGDMPFPFPVSATIIDADPPKPSWAQ